MERVRMSVAAAVAVLASGLVSGAVFGASTAASHRSPDFHLSPVSKSKAATSIPAGYVPVVTSESHTASLNSIVQLKVYLRSATGRLINLATSARVTFQVNASIGAFLTPSTGSLMVTRPGTYHITATVDGVRSAPYTITVANQPTGVQLTLGNTTVVANGRQTIAVKATILDADEHAMTSFNGRATLTPLLHGTYINPSTGLPISSITFKQGVAHFALKAGTTGGVSDTLSLTGLTSSNGQAVTSSVSYSSAILTYAWATSQPVAIQLSPTTTTLTANGRQLDAIKAAVIDGYGQTVKTFNGTATLMPLLHGSYVNPANGAPVNSITFKNGVAHFAVQAGTTGGVTDTISLTGLSPTGGQPLSGAISYGSTTVSYGWSTSQPVGIQLSADSSILVADGKTTDVIKATVVNGYGQPISDFAGTAMLSPSSHGTYVNPTTGATITSITFKHGVAQFSVKAGNIGGVSDTVTLNNLAAAKAQSGSAPINYGSIILSYSWATSQPAGVQLSAASSTLSADGVKTDQITATVVDGYGEPITSFNGTASLLPIMHGTYVNTSTGATISSITFTHGVATFFVKSGTTGGATDNVSLTGLTSSDGELISTGVSYGSVPITYFWSNNQPAGIQLSEATPTLSADGQQTDDITATVVDGYGQPVSGFNGSATLSPMTHGTYVDPATGAGITTATFTNGVARFAVKAGTVGGVTDTVTLTGLTTSDSQPVAGNVNYGSASVSYTWSTASDIVLTPSLAVVSNNQATEDVVSATVSDSSGAVISGGTPINATFTLTGPGSFAKSRTPVTTLTEYIIPGVPTMLPIWSIPGQSGTLTVKATADGLTAAQVTIKSASTGTASSLVVTPTNGVVDALGTAQASSLPAGTAFTLYTVTLADANGNAVAPATADPLSISDNTNQVGGALQYFAVANGEPTELPLSPSEVGTSISASTGQAQFAIVNGQVGSQSPVITVSDSSGHVASVPYNFTKGQAGFTVFPLDTPSVLTAASSNMEGGQTATYVVQLEDANGNPLSAAGQSVAFYFDRKSNTAKATISGSTTWSSTSPFVAVTNPLGEAFVTVSVPAGAVGAFTLAAAVLGNSSPSYEQVSIQSPSVYTTQLTLASLPGRTTPLVWPSGDMTVGQTLQQYLNGANSGSITGVYVTPENNLGANTAAGDMLQITTSNPNVLSIQGDGNWTALNRSSFVFTGNSQKAMPTIVGISSGVATLTITDLSNPSAPRISEAINVQ